MDYVEVLAMWCVRNGTAFPVYNRTETTTTCLFQGQTYTVNSTTFEASQEVAHKAYVESGIFGKIVTYGFLPQPKKEYEVLIDVSCYSQEKVRSITASIAENVHIVMFVPYNMAVDKTWCDTPFTVYHTVHPWQAAFNMRVLAYMSSRTQSWRQHATLVHIVTKNDAFASDVGKYLTENSVAYKIHA
jgi:hypothetical protein